MIPTCLKKGLNTAQFVSTLFLPENRSKQLVEDMKIKTSISACWDARINKRQGTTSALELLRYLNQFLIVRFALARNLDVRTTVCPTFSSGKSRICHNLSVLPLVSWLSSLLICQGEGTMRLFCCRRHKTDEMSDEQKDGVRHAK